MPSGRLRMRHSHQPLHPTPPLLGSRAGANVWCARARSGPAFVAWLRFADSAGSASAVGLAERTGAAFLGAGRTTLGSPSFRLPGPPDSSSAPEAAAPGRCAGPGRLNVPYWGAPRSEAGRDKARLSNWRSAAAPPIARLVPSAGPR
jgi:hypothetical protein